MTADHHLTDIIYMYTIYIYNIYILYIVTVSRLTCTECFTGVIGVLSSTLMIGAPLLLEVEAIVVVRFGLLPWRVERLLLNPTWIMFLQAIKQITLSP